MNALGAEPRPCRATGRRPPSGTPLFKVAPKARIVISEGGKACNLQDQRALPIVRSFASIDARDEGAWASWRRSSSAACLSASLDQLGREPWAGPPRRPWARRRRGGSAGRRGERERPRGADWSRACAGGGTGRGAEAASANDRAVPRERAGGKRTEAPAMPLALAISVGICSSRPRWRSQSPIAGQRPK